jgi:hypothetical protein
MANLYGFYKLINFLLRNQELCFFLFSRGLRNRKKTGNTYIYIKRDLWSGKVVMNSFPH